MSDEKKGWRYGRVRKHLQNAVYLEMWTIPLYLTAAYSIKAPIRPGNTRPRFEPVPTNADGTPDYARFTQDDYNQHAFNYVLSVAIQEMLHVELAANLLNGVRPEADFDENDPWVKFTGDWAPDFKRLPPVIDGFLPGDVTLGLGPMNVNQAKLFEWIERDDSASPADPEEYAPTYPSIGDFYAAMRFGIKACWEELYPPNGLGENPSEADLLQKKDWASSVKDAMYSGSRSGFLMYFLGGPSMEMRRTHAEAAVYPFSISVYGWLVDAWVRADAALAAIRIQGEGAGAGAKIPAEYTPSDGDPIEIALDNISHWARFQELRALVEAGRIQTYNEPPSDCLENNQRILSQSYSLFLIALSNMFSTDGELPLFQMEKIGDLALTVWKQGGVPKFEWIDPQPASNLHACQGLNACAGQGAGGSGTMPGDGDCATAIDHFCGSGNMCAGQGGCGSQSPDLDPSDPDQWTPNFNSCQHRGGCATPIRINQIFGEYVRPYRPELEGTSVWAYARELMRAKYAGIPAGDPAPSNTRNCLVH